MRKIVITLILLFAVGFLVIEFGSVCIGDGGYSLEVYVTSSAEASIHAVWCGVAPDPQSVFPKEFKPLKAEQVLATYDAETISRFGDFPWQTTARPFRGEPLSVIVPVTTRTSIVFERGLAYRQYRALIVAVEFRGGKRAGKVVEIPHARISRSVAVTFP